jgi:hypothetical protein
MTTNTAPEGEKTKQPRPWFWAEDKAGNLTCLMESGTGAYIVSPQADVSEYGCRIDTYNDVSHAHQAMIAATPLLLAALRDLVDGNASYHGDTIHLEADSHSDAIGRVFRARRAIAKAMGEE